MDILPPHRETAFTTGNTLTVALIVRGLERALELGARALGESNVLIVGASGDVGFRLRPLSRAEGGGDCCSCAETRIACIGLLSEFSGLRIPVEADTDLLNLARRPTL